MSSLYSDSKRQHITKTGPPHKKKKKKKKKKSELELWREVAHTCGVPRGFSNRMGRPLLPQLSFIFSENNFILAA
jgi:hypothetical protein